MSQENLDRLENQTDLKLLEHWRHGNEHAAAILVDRYSIRLAEMVGRKLVNRSTIEPDDIVQSAFGSFFRVAHRKSFGTSQASSLWFLLATFAKRKLARKLERHLAAKREGKWNKQNLETDHLLKDHSGNKLSNELVDLLEEELPAELVELSRLLLAGYSQTEIAKKEGVGDRTVRRRLTVIREYMVQQRDEYLQRESTSVQDSMDIKQTNLPEINYREFVLGRLIGQGAFSKVYRSTLQKDHSVVAIKFLRKRLWESHTANKSFVNEIALATRIRHHNIVKYRGIGRSPHGGIYLVSDWIDGQVLSKQKKLNCQEFLIVMQRIIRATQAIHDQGIIHGDLTPTNVIITESLEPQIIDFGFARRHQFPVYDEASLSSRGGTLGFAAPEQLDPSFGTIGTWTDVYGLASLVAWYVYGEQNDKSHDLEKESNGQRQSLALGLTPHINGMSKLSSQAIELRDLMPVVEQILRSVVAERPPLALLKQRVDEVCQRLSAI